MSVAAGYIINIYIYIVIFGPGAINNYMSWKQTLKPNLQPEPRYVSELNELDWPCRIQQLPLA